MQKHRNRLLSALPQADLSLLEPHLTPVTLERYKYLEYPNRKIEAVYFIEDGIASVVASNGDRAQSEVGVIGYEGVTGLPVILDAARSPNATYIQISGNGLRIATVDFQGALGRSPRLRTIMLRYTQSFFMQIAHTAVANARASVEQRLARWILMAHDRAEGDDVFLTHELLALMLGTRRPGVTEAVRTFVKRGFVKTARGKIIVLDRAGMQSCAGAFYGVPEAEFERLIVADG